MEDNFFFTIASTGFVIAFLHAAIPTHWLPFVLTARAQGWNMPKTLMVTTVAGISHIFFTVVLGVLVAWAGMGLNDLNESIFPYIAGGAIIAFGSYYLWRQVSGQGHSHMDITFGLGKKSHPGHEHEHGHGHGHGHDHGHGGHGHAAAGASSLDASHSAGPAKIRTSDWAAFVTLLVMLTFSPCEGFIPIYVSGIKYGWLGFFTLSVILAVATLAGMIIFTGLTYAGLSRLKLGAIERYEAGVLGGFLVVLGLVIIIYNP